MGGLPPFVAVVLVVLWVVLVVVGAVLVVAPTLGDVVAGNVRGGDVVDEVPGPVAPVRGMAVK